MGRIWKWREEAAGGFWQEARSVLKKNGIIVVPTETYYALAVHPFHQKALARLFALKARPLEKSVLVLVAGMEMLSQVAREVPQVAYRLMKAFWPGPLTIIVPARPGMPALLSGGTGTIGVRQPRHGITLRLLTALGFPVTGTSANRSGRPPLTRAEEVFREFGAGVDLILEAGPCPGGLPSTIVDATSVPPRLVRAGAIPPARLAEVIPEMQSSSS